MFLLRGGGDGAKKNGMLGGLVCVSTRQQVERANHIVPDNRQHSRMHSSLRGRVNQLHLNFEL